MSKQTLLLSDESLERLRQMLTANLKPDWKDWPGYEYEGEG
jgi:hypothetical protein